MPGPFYRLTTARLRLEREWRLWNINRQVRAHAVPDPDQPPVVFFNASSRLEGLSQNAAFTQLTAWGLQMRGIPVVHFACRGGMTRCPLGADPDRPDQPPPCKACAAQTRKLTAAAQTRWFEFAPDPALDAALGGLSVDEMAGFAWRGGSEALGSERDIPLGALTLPSLRWRLRRHHLVDDEPTRALFREFIRSAHRVAVTFDALLREVQPQAAVVFNGLQFPEAAARWVAQQHGIRVITHEVGFQPFSAFFSAGEATAYPIEIPDDFELTPAQQERLERQLSRRVQGDFTMAGITFWPEMRGLDDDFLRRAADFRQIVPVFTNVVFDTSQVHANTVFPQMFAWLDLVLEIIRAHPETLFVIRAHPDEMRAGKESRESVQEWVRSNGVAELPNVLFVGSDEPLSSYDLIRRSKFVLIYNSSIGLEASLLGIPVLCGGQARYTHYPTVFFPQTPQEYRQMADDFLSAETIEVPPAFRHNALRFLYYQFYRAALPFDRYLTAHPTPGYVQFKPFSWHDLLPENSPVMQVVSDGVLRGTPFLMDD